MLRTLKTLLAAAALAAPALTLASVANDEVTSQKLKEADGTASQDTNSGSGVKTGHIQNRAVTGAKLADGAVGSTQLGSGAVTTAKIADGAVTDAKITGPISASKVPALAGYRQRLANEIIVSTDGRGDFASPIDAMASITGASATNPFVVRLMPGVYDLGGNALFIKPYVELVGSGERVTKIVGSGGRDALQQHPPAVVFVDAETAVRDLTIEGRSTAGAITTLVVAIHYGGLATLRNMTLSFPPGSQGRNEGLAFHANSSATRVLVSHVTASLTGDSDTMALYLNANYGQVVVEDSDITVTGGCSSRGIYGWGIGIDVRNTRVTVRPSCPYLDAAHPSEGISGGGFVNIAGSTIDVAGSPDGGVGVHIVQAYTATAFHIDSSRVTGGIAAVKAEGPESWIGASRLVGPVLNVPYLGGSILPMHCFGNYDASYGPVTCP